MAWITWLLDRVERVHLFAWLLDFIKWPKLVTAVVGAIALAVWTWFDGEPWPIVILTGLLTTAGVLALISFVILLTEKWISSRRSNLQIIVNLREIAGLHGPTGERIRWGVKNRSRATIYVVSLRAKECFFTRAIVAPAYRSAGSYKDNIEPIVAEFTHIDPWATETEELFGINYSNKLSRTSGDILSTPQTFTLEARALWRSH